MVIRRSLDPDTSSALRMKKMYDPDDFSVVVTQWDWVPILSLLSSMYIPNMLAVDERTWGEFLSVK